MPQRCCQRAHFAAIDMPGIDVSALLEQQLRHGQIIVLRRHHDGRIAIVIRIAIRVGAGFQQEAGDLDLACADRRSEEVIGAALQRAGLPDLQESVGIARTNGGPTHRVRIILVRHVRRHRGRRCARSDRTGSARFDTCTFGPIVDLALAFFTITLAITAQFRRTTGLNTGGERRRRIRHILVARRLRLHRLRLHRLRLWLRLQHPGRGILLSGRLLRPRWCGLLRRLMRRLIQKMGIGRAWIIRWQVVAVRCAHAGESFLQVGGRRMPASCRRCAV